MRKNKNKDRQPGHLSNGEKATTVIDMVQKGKGYVAMLPEARFGSIPEKRGDGTQAPFPSELTAGYAWAPWGMNDRWPTEVRQKLEKVPMATSAILKLIARMYGNGISYYRNGDPERKPVSIPAVDTWLAKNRIQLKYLIPQFADYRFYMNAFSEGILNKRRDFITGVFHKTAEFSRLEVQNEKSLDIEQLYYSPDFLLGHPPSDGRIAKIPLMPWYDDVAFFERLPGYKFAYHSLFQTPGVTYYARPFWVGIFRKNGVLDGSIAAVEIMNAMMRNQGSIVYQILIPESYFQVRYQEWDTYTDDRRNAIMDALVAEINAQVKGTENAYRSITTFFKQDPISGNHIGKPEIIAFDDKIKKDAWIPTGQHFDAQAVQALGLHPSQIGLAGDGGVMGAGSGSDQREGYNTSITDNSMEQEVILDFLNFTARFNASGGQLWDNVIKLPDWDISFRIDHVYHTTTNDQESGITGKNPNAPNPKSEITNSKS